MGIFTILFEILTLGILLYIIYILSYSIIRGAPYAALSKNRINTMISLLKIKKGKKLADIGSGDGRIVIAAAEKGVLCTGFEINPLLIFISKRKIAKQKLKNISVLGHDYWRENFSKFDYITLYGAPHIMHSLEKKLISEVKPGTKIVTNHFKFPNLKYEKKENDVYLYVIKSNVRV